MWVKSTNIAPTFTASSATQSEQGNYVVEYRSVDRAGNADAIKTVTFTIYRPTVVTVEPAVKATVPSYLGLSFGAPAVLGPFTPGLAMQYTGTMTALVTSSWPSASLAVYDPEHDEHGSHDQRHGGHAAGAAGAELRRDVPEHLWRHAAAQDSRPGRPRLPVRRRR